MTKEIPRSNDLFSPHVGGARLFRAVDGGEDQKEFVGEFLTFDRSGAALRTGFYDHSKPVAGLLRLLLASANFVHEIFEGNSLVRLAVVGTDTGSTANQLADQRPGYAVFLHLPAKIDDCLSKEGGSSLQIKGIFVALLAACVLVIGLSVHSFVIGFRPLGI